jgi:hypothetical protein
MTDANRQLDEEVARAVDTLESDYRTALAEERRLQVDLAEAQVAATDLNRKSIDYSVLEREAANCRRGSC